MSIILDVCYRIIVMHKSDPDVGPVLRGLSHSLAGLPVLVAKVVSHCIDLCPCAEQCSVVAVSLQVSEWQDQQKSTQHHPFSDLFVRV